MVRARLLFLNPALPLTDSGLGHWDLVRFLSQSSCTRLMEEYWWGVHKLHFEQRPLQELDSVLLSGRLYFWQVGGCSTPESERIVTYETFRTGVAAESDYPDSLSGSFCSCNQHIGNRSNW